MERGILTDRDSFKIQFLVFFSLFFLSVFLIFPVKADVMSINAGGSNQTAVTPDKYIEGFFSSLPIIAVEEVPPTPPHGGGGGGGGVPPLNISVSPSNLSIDLAIGTVVQRTVKITNLGRSPVNVTVGPVNVGGANVLLENTALMIPAGGSVDLNIAFNALETPGIYTGTIGVDGKQIFVSLNIKTKVLLFDSNIAILNYGYKLQQGELLKTKVSLIPFGDQERTDVSLIYTIRDYSGKIYLTKAETMLVQDLVTLQRDFDTGNLPVGNYIIGLELTYPNGVAPSSAHFEIIPKPGASLISRIILFLISLILLLLIIILIVLIRRRLKQKEQVLVKKPSEEEAEYESESEETAA